MIKIMMVCHGNICRSPMAEFVFNDLVKKRGLDGMLMAVSSAISREEIGNPVHHGTRRKLAEYGISTAGKHAVQLRKEDYGKYDYLVGMEQTNIRNMQRIVGQDTDHKIARLLDFCDSPRDIADPWYTGDFDRTYADVLEGCEAMLTYLLNQDTI